MASAREFAVKERIISRLCESADSELQNAMSCARAAVDSLRPDFMEACCEAYLASVVAKVRLACSVAVTELQEASEACMIDAMVPFSAVKVMNGQEEAEDHQGQELPVVES